MNRIFAEWEHQSLIQLMFPHKDSDWADTLEEVLPIFEQIATTISKYQKVLICYKFEEDIANIALNNSNPNIKFKQVDSNDTWCRDFGAISLKKDGIELLDFVFNGWGGKFKASLDNQISSKIFDKAILKSIDFELEGGSIEANSKNTIITTKECILNPNRNSHLTQTQKISSIKTYLKNDDLIILQNGSLIGDDTDSHIDMLVRFVDDETIVYTTASQDDENYDSLKAMEDELKAMDRFKLIPLPNMPKIYDKDNNRLPSSYANFLIINGAVLLPIYGDKIQDTKAIKLFRTIFNDRAIEPIDCSKIVAQGGSLHCLSMQYYH
jgi:agmatine/peptidylarginine deiminase